MKKTRTNHRRILSAFDNRTREQKCKLQKAFLSSRFPFLSKSSRLYESDNQKNKLKGSHIDIRKNLFLKEGNAVQGQVVQQEHLGGIQDSKTRPGLAGPSSSNSTTSSEGLELIIPRRPFQAKVLLLQLLKLPKNHQRKEIIGFQQKG